MIATVTRTALLLMLAGLCAAATAQEAAKEILIPIAGRTEGADGSRWRTDLILTNVTAEYEQLPLTVTFATDDAVDSFEINVHSFQTVIIPDFALTRFGRESALGMVTISAAAPDAQIAARARVYNDTPAGQFGQNVLGRPLVALTSESFVPGLTSVGAARANFGVANPGETALTVIVELAHNDWMAYLHEFSVPPLSVRQVSLDSIVEYPQATLRFTAAAPIYAFGSVIDPTSGDASFVAGIPRRPTNDLIVTPSCTNPAPLLLASVPHAAPGWMVMFTDETDPEAMTAALAAKYGFVPGWVVTIVPLFFAELTPATIAQLRCEPAVQLVEQSQSGGVASSRLSAAATAPVASPSPLP